MNWLQSLDTALFRFGNQTVSNPVFDWLMPVVSGTAVFFPALIVLAAWLLWKGGARGRLCVVFLVLALALGDAFVCNMLKKTLARPRPCLGLEGVVLRIGCTETGSMPSSHAANWFGAAMVALIYYRRSAWFMLPMAGLVACSRVYNGVHYPSDILAGALLGAGYAAAFVWSMDALWRRAGARWFPIWQRRLPSLLQPGLRGPAGPAAPGEAAEAGRQWVRLGYLLLGVLLAARLGYLATGRIELSKDEAYQWLWSKHLALSYYSKPPMIAWLHWAGTHIWGDRELGSRFFSPVLGTVLGALLLRFMAAAGSPRAGFWLLAALTATPLIAVGTILITVDPPLVLFWCAAMIAGWRAVQTEGRARDWLWVGLWTGLGFLSKYTALLQLACWGLVFAALPRARGHLRRPGPWLALGVTALCSLPVVVWNSQNGWVTAAHVAENAKLNEPWKFTLRYMGEFTAVELALLNPVFIVAALWAAGAFWKRSARRPLLAYLTCMGAPVLLGHWLYTLHSRVLPNWIAVSAPPMLCVMALYWEERWEAGSRAVKRWLTAGLAVGLPLVLLAHHTDWIQKLAGNALPPQADVLRRVRAWRDTAAVVEEARQRFIRETGKPVFLIGEHYGMAGELAFYLPEARESVQGRPLVFCRRAQAPDNQFYFWPGYRESRAKGENALYVREVDLPALEPGWIGRWLAGRSEPPGGPVRGLAGEPEPELLADFESVTSLGVLMGRYKGRDYRPVQVFACRGLR